MNNKSVHKILLIKRGSLGDVLLTTPLVRAIRLQYPDARIDYLVGEWSVPALLGNPDITTIIPFRDDRNIAVLFLFMLPLIIRSFFVRYDVVFALDKAWQAGLLARVLNRRYVEFGAIKKGCIDTGDLPHDIFAYLALGKRIGCASGEAKMVFVTRTEDAVYAKKNLQHLPKSFIAICPGGARNPYQEMLARKWPKERYAELTKKVIKKGIGVVILGSKSDEAEANYILRSCSNSALVRSLAGTTTFSQVAVVLSLCKAVVSHDTALMHLAFAMNVPVIALFGPTNPALKKPLNAGSATIWDDTPCFFCGKRVCHFENAPVDPRCVVRMERISVMQVFDKLSLILNT